MHNLSPYGKTNCSIAMTSDSLFYSCDACTDAGQLVMQSSVTAATRLLVIVVSASDRAWGCSARDVRGLTHHGNLKRQMLYCMKYLLYGALCSCRSSCWAHQQKSMQTHNLLSNLWVGMCPGHQQAAQVGQQNQIQGKFSAWYHQYSMMQTVCILGVQRAKWLVGHR